MLLLLALQRFQVLLAIPFPMPFLTTMETDTFGFLGLSRPFLLLDAFSRFKAPLFPFPFRFPLCLEAATTIVGLGVSGRFSYVVFSMLQSSGNVTSIFCMLKFITKCEKLDGNECKIKSMYSSLSIT